MAPLSLPVRALLAVIRDRSERDDPLGLVTRLGAQERIEFLDLLKRHGLAGWAHTIYTEEGIELPEDLEAALRVEHIAHTASAVIALDAYQKISKVLSNAGVEHIPLKGVRFLESLYPDLGTRTLGDIDVLVRSADLARADAALVEAGISGSKGRQRERLIRFHHHLHHRIPGQIPRLVELHWRASSCYGFCSGSDYLWEGVTRCHEGSAECVMAPDVEFHSLLLHIANHGYNLSLKWLVDLRLLLVGRSEFPLTSRGTYELALSTRTVGCCVYALGLLKHLVRARGVRSHSDRLLGALPPGRRLALESLGQPGWFFGYARTLRRKWPAYAFQVWLADDWLDRYHVIKRSVSFKMHLEGLI